MAQGGISSAANSASNTPFAPQQQPNAGGGQTVTGGPAVFPGFGGQQQPNAGSQFNAAQNPGANQSNVPDWVQAPEPGAATSQAFRELTNPATGETFMAPSGGYSVRQQQPMQQQQFGSYKPMQLPMQPFGMQQPEMMMSDMQYRPQQQNPYGFDQRAINADPRGFQNYMQQMQQREQQRPGSTMLDQPQPRQNPYARRQFNPYQQQFNPYQQQQQFNPYQQQQQFNPYQQQFNPYQQRMQQQQYQQPRGLQGLMGMLGGRGGMAQRGSYEQYVDSNNRALASPTQEVKQPTMSRADFEAREQQLMSRLQPRMSMDMPQTYGHMEALPQNFMKNGGKV